MTFIFFTNATLLLLTNLVSSFSYPEIVIITFVTTMSDLNLRRLNDRLDALETCLLTMTDLRLHLCKDKIKYGLFGYCRSDWNEYKEERRHIDTFLEYLFAQEEYHRNLRDEVLKNLEKNEKNQRKRIVSLREKLHFLTRSFHTLLKNQVFSRPLKGKNWMKLCRLSGYKILEDGSGSDEDDMLPGSLILRKNFARLEFSLSNSF